MSDDFSGAELAPAWIFVDPVGNASFQLVGEGTADPSLSISVPAGSAHDPWGQNGSARLVQLSADSDFEFETKFGSSVTQAYQMQGILVEQDGDDFVRFEVHHDGTTNRFFAASFLGGSGTTQANVALGASTPAYLRVRRQGNSWTAWTSANGQNWTQRASFSHALTVIQAGVFAGNAGPNPAHTATFDYFFDNASPIANEDQPNCVGGPFHVTLTSNGPGSASLSAPGPFNCGDSVVVTATPTAGNKFYNWSSDLTGATNPRSVFVTADRSIVANFGPIPPVVVPASDDFSGTELNLSRWQFVDPVGDSSYALAGTGTSAAVAEIFVPAGSSHDPWGTNWAPRLMQSISDTDFVIETKFESLVTEAFEMQGLMVEQANGDFLRADLYSDGLNVRFFVATSTSGSMDGVLDLPVSAAAKYVRLSRTSDVWVAAYSTTGSSWTTGATFEHAFEVAKVGIHAGNAGANPGHTARFDYFFNVASPVQPEDPTVCDGPFTIDALAVGSAPGTISVSPAGPYDCDEVVLLTAVPGAGSQFVAWGGGLTGSQLSQQVTVNTNLSITAEFAPQAETCTGGPFQLDLQTSGAGSGQIVASVPGPYACGQTVALSAVPAAGSTFAGFSGGLTGTQNPQSVVVNSALSITATFIPNQSCAGGPFQIVTTKSGTGTGQIVASAPGPYACGQVVTLTATPDSGSIFSGFSGGLTGGTSQQTVTMLSNLSVDGQFTAVTWSVPLSDDFSAPTLNPIWTFLDPVGDSDFVLAGAGTSEALLEIDVPAGTAHDAWGSNQSARVVQPVANVDFTVEAKFQSAVLAAYQSQGIVIEQSHNTFIRIDTYGDGANTHFFVVSGANGAMTTHTNLTVPSATRYIRVARTGSSYTASYSSDGASWTQGVTFTNGLETRYVGVSAGNAGGNPGHTARVDYFFNTASPIIPEDPINCGSSGPFSVNVQKTGQGTVTASPAGPYACGQTVTLTATPGLNHGVFTGWGGAVSGTAASASFVISGNVNVTAAFEAPHIFSWHGDYQTVGDRGEVQPAVDLLGEVVGTGTISSVTFAVNGGAHRNLDINPETNPRIGRLGNFDAYVKFVDLKTGLNPVQLVATFSDNFQLTKTVVLNYEPGNVWPLPYTADFTAPGVTSASDIAEVVDGRWAIDPGQGVRTLEPAYDRLIAVGDSSWVEYEAKAEITVHNYIYNQNSAGFGIIGRWPGHVGPASPPYIWWPLGCIGMYRYYSTPGVEMFDPDGAIRDFQATPSIQRDVPYLMKLRVESRPDNQLWCGFRMWEKSQPEPSAWQVESNTALTVAPPGGSVVLIAHHVDATYANVSVTPINSGYGAPPEWQCNRGIYHANDGCDCGCGAPDPDCADSTRESCDTCHVEGSCGLNVVGCGDIDPVDNATCIVPTSVVVMEGHDQGQESFIVRTPTADYSFHKRGGGLASLVDREGRDWLGYRPTGGYAGDYRGIPQMGACCHPGYPDIAPGKISMITTLEIETPTHVQLLSRSANGLWSLTWNFYPDHISATVNSVGGPYYFGYEGPPGGSIEALGVFADYLQHADGTTSDMRTETGFDWHADNGNPEWVGMVDPRLGRSLLMIQHQGDNIPDRVWNGDDKMMVVMHGRLDHGDVRGLTGSLTFSFALVDTMNFTSMEAKVAEITGN